MQCVLFDYAEVNKTTPSDWETQLALQVQTDHLFRKKFFKHPKFEYIKLVGCVGRSKEEGRDCRLFMLHQEHLEQIKKRIKKRGFDARPKDQKAFHHEVVARCGGCCLEEYPFDTSPRPESS